MSTTNPAPGSVESWARTVLSALRTAYPWNAGHCSMTPDDTDVTPRRLHPAFHGSFDWHSSAHMQWSALTLLDGATGALPEQLADDLAAELDSRLTHPHLSVEADYLAARPGYERPYGWGWVCLLAAAATRSRLPRADVWAENLEPVVEVVLGHLVAWLPRLVHPVRVGTHTNTAFGLSLLLEAATTLGRRDVVDAIRQAATAWFSDDRNYPISWEPSGTDFLSAGLCEARLMAMVLPSDRVGTWLSSFLPGLGGPDDPLLDIPEVRDPTDGTLVHLHGLALSRAWHLAELSPYLPVERAERVRQAGQCLMTSAAAATTSGDFMSTHWLVTFALRAHLAQSQAATRASGLGKAR